MKSTVRNAPFENSVTRDCCPRIGMVEAENTDDFECAPLCNHAFGKCYL